MTEENLEIRKKVFCNWINEKVGERDKKLKITKDKLAKGAFSDGTLLATLFEVVSGTSLSGINTKPKSREEKVKNVSIVFDAMRKRGYVEATVDSIIDSNEIKTLDTIWRLFALFELKRPGLKPSEGAAEMVQWLSGSGFDVADLTKSWHRNAVLMITLVNTIRSDLIPLKFMTKDAKKNAQKAIDVAASDLAIPPLIEGGDFISDEPDYVSNFVYLSYFKANHPTLKTQTVSASAVSETSATTQSESTKKNDSDEEPAKEADKEEISRTNSKADDKEDIRSKKVERTKSSEKTMGKNAPRSKSAPRLNRITSDHDESTKPSSASSSPKKKKMTTADRTTSKQESENEGSKVKEAPKEGEEKIVKPKEDDGKEEKNTKVKEEKASKPKAEKEVDKKETAKEADKKKEKDIAEPEKSKERREPSETDASSDAPNSSPQKPKVASLTRSHSKTASGSSGAIITPQSSNSIISKLRSMNEERRSNSGDTEGIVLNKAAAEEAKEKAEEKEKPKELKPKSSEKTE